MATLVEMLLDAASNKGDFDLIADYAAAIPVEVVRNMLRVPHADRGPLRDGSLAIRGALKPVTSPPVTERGNRAVLEFSEYLADLIDDRRHKSSHYADDVMGRLIDGLGDGDQLSDLELIQICIFILNAGHETTTNLIGNGVAA
ncbi:MAG: cytochrome P450, partial [Pseudomonadota bacterium]|nr:cytochrome P450 [Pseudomonadota bacterium]